MGDAEADLDMMGCRWWEWGAALLVALLDCVLWSWRWWWAGRGAEWDVVRDVWVG